MNLLNMALFGLFIIICMYLGGFLINLVIVAISLIVMAIAKVIEFIANMFRGTKI